MKTYKELAAELEPKINELLKYYEFICASNEYDISYRIEICDKYNTLCDCFNFLNNLGEDNYV